MANLPYVNDSNPDATLLITKDLIATITMIDVESATVQLNSLEDVDGLIAEFEDESGDLGAEDNSVMNKYEELKRFHP